MYVGNLFSNSMNYRAVNLARKHQSTPLPALPNGNNCRQSVLYIDNPNEQNCLTEISLTNHYEKSPSDYSRCTYETKQQPSQVNTVEVNPTLDNTIIQRSEGVDQLPTTISLNITKDKCECSIDLNCDHHLTIYDTLDPCAWKSLGKVL